MAPKATTGLDPYAAQYGAENYQLGFPLDEEGDGEGWHDNIHNHTIKY